MSLSDIAPLMVIEFDIWRGAKLLIDRYGEAAPAVAQACCKELADSEADPQSRETLMQIARVIEKLYQSSSPPIE